MLAFFSNWTLSFLRLLLLPGFFCSFGSLPRERNHNYRILRSLTIRFWIGFTALAGSAIRGLFRPRRIWARSPIRRIYATNLSSVFHIPADPTSTQPSSRASRYET